MVPKGGGKLCDHSNLGYSELIHNTRTRVVGGYLGIMRACLVQRNLHANLRTAPTVDMTVTLQKNKVDQVIPLLKRSMSLGRRILPVRRTGILSTLTSGDVRARLQRTRGLRCRLSSNDHRPLRQASFGLIDILVQYGRVCPLKPEKQSRHKPT